MAFIWAFDADGSLGLNGETAFVCAETGRTVSVSDSNLLATSVFATDDFVSPSAESEESFGSAAGECTLVYSDAIDEDSAVQSSKEFPSATSGEYGSLGCSADSTTFVSAESSTVFSKAASTASPDIAGLATIPLSQADSVVFSKTASKPLARKALGASYKAVAKRPRRLAEVSSGLEDQQDEKLGVWY